MGQPTTLERYPAWTVAVATALNLAIYALGAAIVARLGWALLVPYLALPLYLEVALLTKSCPRCFYYGKRCFSGKGLLSALICRRRDPAEFAAREITWLSLLPDLLVTLIPLAVGVVLSIRRFEWTLVGAVVGLMVLAFPGTGFVRSRLACCHCRQRLLGCPAENLFRRQGS
jgi:hypothetical protein